MPGDGEGEGKEWGLCVEAEAGFAFVQVSPCHPDSPSARGSSALGGFHEVRPHRGGEGGPKIG